MWDKIVGTFFQASFQAMANRPKWYFMVNLHFSAPFGRLCLLELVEIRIVALWAKFKNQDGGDYD